MSTQSQPLPNAIHLALFLGVFGIAFGWLGINFSGDVSWIKFFDNLHWTIATSAAGFMSWVRCKQTASKGSKGFCWIMFGLIGYAFGQICWDIQITTGYSAFPAPSDFFYLMLGPCITAGLLQEVAMRASKADKRSVWLDSLLLTVTMVTLILVLYLPKRSDTELIPLLILIAYPATLFAATGTAIITLLTLRTRISVYLQLAVLGLVISAFTWMHWNFLALDDIAADGSWMNILFSASILLTGLGFSQWKIEKSTDIGYDRFCEGFLRLLPITAVILASLSVIVSDHLSSLPELVKNIVDIGAVVVIVLAIIRQAALLKERDELIATSNALDESQMQLSQERSLLKSLVGTIPDLIWLKDKEGVYLSCNPMFERFFGATEHEIKGKTDYDFVDQELADSFRKHDLIAMKAGTPSVNEEWLAFSDGDYRGLFETIKTPMYDGNGHLTGVIGISRDITERKIASDEIENLAFFDPLTQLPNRRLLIDRLNHSVAGSARSGQRGALLFLDLDHFKDLNDTLGHDVGDLLLQQVAARLTDCVREDDTVARLGGDEFVLLLEDLSEHAFEAATQAESVAEKILAALNQPYLLGSHKHRSTPSIGATLFRGHEVDVDELLKQADIAMYQAKKSGRNALRFYDPKMQEAITARTEIEGELRNAIEQQELQLHYQMQVDSTGKALGAEALIRWNHPKHGMITPFHFIPLAEDCGLIVQIGQWVLDTACAQLNQWEQNLLTRNLALAVNVSAKQFKQVNFVDQLKATLQRHGADPAKLKLELTESILAENVEHIIATMTELGKIGVKFSLDDFGTGYSSLQYLKSLPLDQLKVDQSFVRDIATDSSDKAITLTIITMAHNLGLDVIAEGVETEDQRQFLKDNGCQHYQGYLFSKPVPIDAFERLLIKS